MEEEPVAICRLKRVAADFKGDVKSLIPGIPSFKNGKKCFFRIQTNSGTEKGRIGSSVRIKIKRI